MIYKRCFVIVCDSLGIGNAKDADKFNDLNSNTFGHIIDNYPDIKIPTLLSLGVGDLITCNTSLKLPKTNLGYTLKMNELSNGKDTMTGHWEMMGLRTNTPFVTFTENGFPDEFIKEFEEKTGHKCVGNIACSGTEILDMYGEHQIKTGDWIVYTSADSVFQIAANEEIIPLEELYKACDIARKMAMKPKWKVGRIIARPYIGKKVGEFSRTSNRHDYALSPEQDTALDLLKQNNLDVISIGKISDIFNGKGITRSIRTISNDDGMIKTIALANENFTGLAFVNLVDFDANFGHRRNVSGYARAIEEFDVRLKELIDNLNNDDLLMITADHGNDPTYPGTDHTREQVPLIIYNKKFTNVTHLTEVNSFGTIGATIIDNFKIVYNDYLVGDSILDQLV